MNLRLTGAPLALILAALALAPVAAALSPRDGAGEGMGDPAAARQALTAAAQALAPAPGAVPDREATHALAELARALPALSGEDRRRARALLARPTDGADDSVGDGYPAGAEVRSAASSPGNFCVTWVESGAEAPPLADASGSGMPDYVEAIQRIAERAYRVQVGKLGWREPVPDQREECGEPDQVDIYLKDVGRRGSFGYQAIDPGQSGRQRHGYLVIDNDYGRAQFPEFARPLDAARVTIAHELNHLLQAAISFFQDDWMFESTATWMERKVFPRLDDYLRYVGHFARFPHRPITSADVAGGQRMYGAAVWSHWLERGDSRFGADVIRRAWEASESTQPRDFAIDAYRRAIVDLGGDGFSDEFVPFAAATAEWRTGDGGFPDARRYPQVARDGFLRPGPRNARELELDHTTYRLLRVPRLEAARITLRVSAQRGLRAGYALVGRRGPPARGKVVRRVRYLPRGGRGSAVLPNPGRFDRITAVLVNADGRVSRRTWRGWVYERDRQAFEARLTARR